MSNFKFKTIGYGEIGEGKSGKYIHLILDKDMVKLMAPHDLAEGIHDVEGDRRAGVRTYATSFGEKTAATISVVMILLAGIFGIMLYLWTTLTLLYLVPFVLLWLYTLFLFSRLMKAEGDERKQLGKILGRKGFNFLLFTYALIFLDVFVQMITLTYFHWMLP